VRRLIAAAGAAPILIVACYRSEEGRPDLDAALDGPSVTRVALGRLEQGAIDQMVRGMLSLRRSEPALIEFISRESSGNPFFIAEYLRAAIADKLLSRNGTGGWQLAAAAGAELAVRPPMTITEVISRRLETLSGIERRLVQAAAVIGREFDPDLACAVAQLDGTAALDGLEGLRRKQIVEEHEPGTLAFIHDKLREAAYAGLGGLRATQLHREAAQALEARLSLAGSPPSFQSAALGFHWERAGVPDRAAPWYARAADLAREVYANQDAIRLYRSALAQHALSSDQQASDERAWQERLGDVLALVGAEEDARRAFDRAREIAADSVVATARLLRKSAKTWEARHGHGESLAFYDQAEAVLGPAPQAALDGEPRAGWWQEWVQIQVDKAWNHYFLAQVDELTSLVSRVRPIVERHGSPVQRARLLQALVNTNLRRERYLVSGDTVEFARRSMSHAEESGEPAEMALAAFVLGFNLLFHDAVDEAERMLSRALELSCRVGDRTVRARSLTYLSVAHRRRRAPASTQARSEETRVLAVAENMLDYVGVAEANIAWVHLHHREWSNAEERARAALAAWEQLPPAYPYPLSWLGRLPLIAAVSAREQWHEGQVQSAALVAEKQAMLPEPLMTAVRRCVGASSAALPSACRNVVTTAEQIGFI
jgi:hypothetical protein